MNAPHVSSAGVTDVGRVREANEDDLYVGETVVAVADGMGGHLAGEIASKTALEPVRALDGQVFEDAETALQTLRAAVVQANATVSQMAADEPTYRGMGTTLTAAMLEGRRLHLAHVGDSRAYLLRSGDFSQITDDHTFVQHLIDEGQITAEEAASHPQRSIITRAIGVSPQVDVDAMSLELEDGDQVLLCSDGLTGVVDDATISRELASGDELDDILGRLVEAANRAGGPDNITAVLLRYGAPPDPAATSAAAPVRIGTRDEDAEADWADRLGSYGARGHEGHDEEEGRSTGRLLAKVGAGLLGLAVLAAVVVFGGQFLLDRSYFVGLDGDEVVIYQGIDAELGPLELSRVVERTGLEVDDFAAYYASTLEDGVQATDLADARRIVEGAPRSDQDDTGPTTAEADPDDADGPS